jgi:hypothetical protein
MNNVNPFQDQTLNCRDCKQPFLFEAGEQAFFAEKGFTSPTRCKPCRQARKAQKDMQNGGGAPAPQGGSSMGGSAQVTSYVEVADQRKPAGKGRRRHDEPAGKRGSRGYDSED